MSKLPWDEIRGCVSVEVFLVLAAITRAVLAEARDPRLLQVAKIAEGFGDSASASGRDPRVRQDAGITTESGDSPSSGPKDPTDSGQAAA